MSSLLVHRVFLTWRELLRDCDGWATAYLIAEFRLKHGSASIPTGVMMLRATCGVDGVIRLVWTGS